MAESKCLSCPSHSTSLEASTSCDCQSGYYPPNTFPLVGCLPVSVKVIFQVSLQLVGVTSSSLLGGVDTAVLLASVCTTMALYNCSSVTLMDQQLSNSSSSTTVTGYQVSIQLSVSVRPEDYRQFDDYYVLYSSLSDILQSAVGDKSFDLILRDYSLRSNSSLLQYASCQSLQVGQMVVINQSPTLSPSPPPIVDNHSGSAGSNTGTVVAAVVVSLVVMGMCLGGLYYWRMKTLRRSNITGSVGREDTDGQVSLVWVPNDLGGGEREPV